MHGLLRRRDGKGPTSSKEGHSIRSNVSETKSQVLSILPKRWDVQTSPDIGLSLPRIRSIYIDSHPL